MDSYHSYPMNPKMELFAEAPNDSQIPSLPAIHNHGWVDASSKANGDLLRYPDGDLVYLCRDTGSQRAWPLVQTSHHKLKCGNLVNKLRCLGEFYCPVDGCMARSRPKVPSGRSINATATSSRLENCPLHPRVLMINLPCEARMTTTKGTDQEGPYIKVEHFGKHRYVFPLVTFRVLCCELNSLVSATVTDQHTQYAQRLLEGQILLRKSKKTPPVRPQNCMSDRHPITLFGKLIQLTKILAVLGSINVTTVRHSRMILKQRCISTSQTATVASMTTPQCCKALKEVHQADRTVASGTSQQLKSSLTAQFLSGRTVSTSSTVVSSCKLHRCANV